MAKTAQAADAVSIETLQAQVAALTALLGAQAPQEVDFSEAIREAEKNENAVIQVIPSLQKGASPALRVDN